MNQHVAPPPGKLTAEEFWDFIKDRPREERWQLIDGEPFLMMSPARLNHQRIGLNLVTLLNGRLAETRPDLCAMYEIALQIGAVPDFRPVADVVVLDADADDTVYVERFYLAAEVLSDSNTVEHISRKRTLYAEAPDCLYVLIISQKDFAVEVWAKGTGWQGHVYRSPDDLIELPEFGFFCRVGDLYRSVQLP